ncbi:hypothetical protein [Terriglobus tenax]|uniref:hypothetical protein n=1 Tax=Terriglobus tenax TaxID=1111115 RepID=UPI0021E06785|nr:hypothetical protein [Terriglobus tenax]
MANITIRFGFLLILVGVIFFVLTGHTAVTSLIPAFFGVALLVLGFAARTENTKQRMMVMHVAVTIGLLGFLFPAIRALKAYLAGPILRPLAVREEVLMAVICFIYTLLCVRSFIAARRARLV